MTVTTNTPADPATIPPGEGDVVLDVRGLRTQFEGRGRVVKAVDGVSYTVRAGRTLAVVGESGSGKSATAFSILRLLPPSARITAGEVLFQGEDLLKLSEEQIRRKRGREIAMIFQEPMTALNPVLTIGRQLTEGLEIHLGMDKAAARARAVELLEMVRISDPERHLDEYPHQFSGGMLQRVVLAMALSCEPALILADEPTTALDVTVQAQVLDMMQALSTSRGVATVLITHNLGLVARYADDVAVMYAGKVVERAPVDELFAAPQHPYTRALLESVPRLGDPTGSLLTIPGQPPDLSSLPRGCSFQARCVEAHDRCREEEPALWQIGGHHCACWARDRFVAEGTPA